MPPWKAKEDDAASTAKRKAPIVATHEIVTEPLVVTLAGVQYTFGRPVLQDLRVLVTTAPCRRALHPWDDVKLSKPDKVLKGETSFIFT